MTADSAHRADTVSDLAREVLTESKESARAYLRQGWLYAAVRALREARQSANLTQGEVAQCLGTTQSAIARLESDHEGRITLHRYIDYALACDMCPLDLDTLLVPAERLRAFAIQDPDAPRTPTRFTAWCDSQQPSNAAWITFPADIPADIGPSAHTVTVDYQLQQAEGHEWVGFADWMSPEQAPPMSFVATSGLWSQHEMVGANLMQLPSTVAYASSPGQHDPAGRGELDTEWPGEPSRAA